jgi:hypothetical protein
MTTDKYNIPKWLKRAQENSWEAEILLSGLVLFALLKIPSVLEKLGHLVDINLVDSNIYMIFIEFAEVAVSVLISGFITHLIFRGIWVGLIGLSFVFPQGPNISKLKYSEKYKKRLQKLPTPTKIILKVEKICSLIFSSAFLLTGYVIGTMLFLSLLVLLAELTDVSVIFKYLTGIYLVLAIIYFFDFITGGTLKRIRWLTPVYYPIYFFFSILTLSFLYRNIYYTLITNVKKWKIYVGIGLYIIAFLIISKAISYNDGYQSSESNLLTTLENKNKKESLAYDNLRDDQLIKKAAIQSDVIKENYVRLFIVHDASLDDRLGERYTNEKQETENAIEFINRGFNTLYQVKIDKQVYRDLKWSFYMHPKTKESGISTIINIDDINPGWHKINISILQGKDETDNASIKLVYSSNASNTEVTNKQQPDTISEQYDPDTYISIPFYKVKI